MLPARHRLRRSADFRAAGRGPGRARAGGRFVVIHLSRTDQRERPVRVGFVVGKNVGTAVVRNRTKRRLRALVATRIPGLPNDVDVVVRALPTAGEVSFADLGAELDRLLGRVCGQAGMLSARTAGSGMA